jgi:hypothetical protein
MGSLPTPSLPSDGFLVSASGGSRSASNSPIESPNHGNLINKTSKLATTTTTTTTTSITTSKTESPMKNITTSPNTSINQQKDLNGSGSNVVAVNNIDSDVGEQGDVSYVLGGHKRPRRKPEHPLKSGDVTNSPAAVNTNVPTVRINTSVSTSTNTGTPTKDIE